MAIPAWGGSPFKDYQRHERSAQKKCKPAHRLDGPNNAIPQSFKEKDLPKKRMMPIIKSQLLAMTNQESHFKFKFESLCIIYWPYCCDTGIEWYPEQSHYHSCEKL
jgi:hypothetical protein